MFLGVIILGAYAYIKYVTRTTYKEVEKILEGTIVSEEEND